MGKLIMVECSCGFVHTKYHYGVTSPYPEIKKHQTALTKSGRYGVLWKRSLLSSPDLCPDAQYLLYQCPFCHLICDTYSLDIYKPASVHKNPYYTPAPEEIIFHYKHICPRCNKKMIHIPLLVNQYGLNDNKEEPVYCPECHGIAIASFCGHFD